MHTNLSKEKKKKKENKREKGVQLTLEQHKCELLEAT